MNSEIMPNYLVAKWKVRLTTGVPPPEPPADAAEQNNEEKNDTEKNKEDTDKDTGKTEKNQDEKEDGGKGMCGILCTFFVTFLTRMHASRMHTACFSGRPGGG